MLPRSIPIEIHLYRDVPQTMSGGSCTSPHNRDSVDRRGITDSSKLIGILINSVRIGSVFTRPMFDIAEKPALRDLPIDLRGHLASDIFT